MYNKIHTFQYVALKKNILNFFLNFSFIAFMLLNLSVVQICFNHINSDSFREFYEVTDKLFVNNLLAIFYS